MALAHAVDDKVEAAYRHSAPGSESGAVSFWAERGNAGAFRMVRGARTACLANHVQTQACSSVFERLSGASSSDGLAFESLCAIGSLARLYGIIPRDSDPAGPHVGRSTRKTVELADQIADRSVGRHVGNLERIAAGSGLSGRATQTRMPRSGPINHCV